MQRSYRKRFHDIQCNGNWNALHLRGAVYKNTDIPEAVNVSPVNCYIPLLPKRHLCTSAMEVSRTRGTYFEGAPVDYRFGKPVGHTVVLIRTSGLSNEAENMAETVCRMYLRDDGCVVVIYGRHTIQQRAIIPIQTRNFNLS